MLVTAAIYGAIVLAAAVKLLDPPYEALFRSLESLDGSGTGGALAGGIARGSPADRTGLAIIITPEFPEVSIASIVPGLPGATI